MSIAVADEQPSENPLARTLDWLCDLSIVAFSVWTVIYHIGRPLRLGTDLLLVATVVLTLVVGLPVWRAVGVRVDRPRTTGGPARTGQLAALSLVLGMIGAAVIAAHSAATYALGWGVVALSVLPIVVAVVGTERQRGTENVAPPSPAAARPGAVAHLVVLLLGITASVAGLLSFRIDPDDAFYVNKAVFVAEHGQIPLRDTVFSDQVYPALRGAGTAPVQSVEVFQGAVAHLAGMAGGTVAYLLTPAVAGLLAVWTLWRLLRSWVPRRVLVALVVALFYYVLGGKTGYTLGVFFIARIWQGKVLFVCIVLPMTYLFLTRWARYRDRYDAMMLFALGIAAVGLTSTATFLVPIIAVCVAVALLLARRPGWWGALLPAVYPLASGAVVAVETASSPLGNYVFASWDAVQKVFGGGLWAIVSLLALVLGAWLVPAGATRAVVGGGVVGAVIVLAPGFPELLNALTGAGPVLWRLAWIAPIPALVGVLAAANLPAAVRPRVDLRALTVAVPAAVLVMAFVGGTFIWSPSRFSTLSDTPTWKYPLEYLRDARAIARIYDGSQPVLASDEVMRAMALTTTRIHAVDPRVFYVPSLDEPADQREARIGLTDVMAPKNGRPGPTFGQQLKTLDVGLVCLAGRQKKVRAVIQELGWGSPAKAGRLRCYRPPG